MTPTPAARPLLRRLVLLAACLAWSCQPLMEGQLLFARIELVIANPTPDMLTDDETFCHVANDPMFVLFKELSGSGVSPSITRVNVGAARSGRVDADTNACVLPLFMRWNFGRLYNVVATDGAGWLTRCNQSLQFFVIPPARHLIRFTVGDEGCSTEVLLQG